MASGSTLRRESSPLSVTSSRLSAWVSFLSCVEAKGRLQQQDSLPGGQVYGGPADSCIAAVRMRGDRAEQAATSDLMLGRSCHRRRL